MGEINWTNHYELFHWLIEIEYIWRASDPLSQFYLSCGVLSTLAASTCTNISYITEWIPNDVKVLWLY